MKKYEYHIEKISLWKPLSVPDLNVEKYEKEFNSLGEEGWELVSSSAIATCDGETSYMIFVFKREI